MSVKKGTKKSKSARRGRTSAFAGKHIVKLVEDNPRRKGTVGAKSFDKIKNGMSYEQYIEDGGRPQDIRYDVTHKFVKLTA